MQLILIIVIKLFMALNVHLFKAARKLIDFLSYPILSYPQQRETIGSFNRKLPSCKHALITAKLSHINFLTFKSLCYNLLTTKQGM
jgi:hypothetical protein